ncbi:MAG: phage scaffolding protein [Spirochaetia bacterium]|nr:phage scaffolding protein [Spirochaetia bacterium]
MTREFLENLKLEKDVVDKIMAENGKDIEATKAKYADRDDLKKQLEEANKTIEKFKDYDQAKEDVKKWKEQYENSQKENLAKIAEMERSAKVGDFLYDKKFVNSITKDAIKKQLADMLADEKNAGKAIKDLFDELVKDKSDILKDETAPTPPVVSPMKGGKGGNADDDAQARAIMGLPPKKE